MQIDDTRRSERGSALVIALLISLLLFSLGLALLAVSETENLIAANDHFAEGAFQAAEASVQVALDQIDIGATDLTVPETEIGNGFVFRSGRRDDIAPQPPQLVTRTPGAGFAVGSSTGYNAAGYSFEVYEITGTGTGPRNTEREVEVQVELGPVAQ